MRQFLYHLGQAFRALLTGTGERAHADAIGLLETVEQQANKAFVQLDDAHDRLTLEIARRQAEKIALRAKAAQAKRIRDYIASIKVTGAPPAA